MEDTNSQSQEQEDVIGNPSLEEEAVEIDHSGEKPTKLAQMLSKVLNKNSDSDEDSEDNAKYRDVELEREVEAEKKRINDIEKELQEQQRTKEAEKELVEEIRGEEHKSKTKREIQIDAKKIKKKAREITEEIDIDETRKKRKRREEEIEEVSKYSRGGLLKIAKNLVQKINAYRMHAITTPGRQAGIFDNFMTKKDDLVHSSKQDAFDMGTEVITREFKADINGVEISGHISQRFDDKSDGKLIPVSGLSISMDSVQSHGQRVSTSSLGRLSPQDVLNEAKRDGGISR